MTTSDDLRRELDELFSGKPPTMTRDEAAARFGDYGDLILGAATGASEVVVQHLCRITTPVSSNVLHHVATMDDVTSERLVEVPYDAEHPNGEKVIVTVHRCDRARRLARNALRARGDPSYDVAVYEDPDCWRLAPAGASGQAGSTTTGSPARTVPGRRTVP